MKQIIFTFYFCVAFLFTTQAWGQTWNLTPTMTATLDNAGVLTISTSASSEAMPDYPTYAAPYIDAWENIHSIVIEDKVTTIGNAAFMGCNDLASATIPNSVKSIGEWAFAYTGLASVTIPNSIESVGNFAFTGCNFASMLIPNSVTTIGSNAFSSCTSLTSVTVNWITPLSVPVDIFSNVDMLALTLHVPTGTKAPYQADPVWGAFGTIVENETQDATPKMMYVMKNGAVVFSSPVSGIDNVTFDEASPDSTLIVHKNDGSPIDKILLNDIQQLSFSDDNLSVETPNGIEIYAFDDIAKLFFGDTNTTKINNPTQRGFDVLVYVTPAGDVTVKSSIPIKSLTLFSVDGKMISKKYCSGTVETWHAASLQGKPAGVYLLRVETEQDAVVKKIVKPQNK